MKIERAWGELLGEELKKEYVKKLKEFLEEEEQRGETIYPPEGEVFQALKLTPPAQVKVVIVGQDPYHGPGQAHGLAFSVKKGVRPPPSLKNIFKELVDDVHIPPPTQGELTDWAKQGVLLLNATLTVRKGEPKSHYGKGWEILTDTIVEKICEQKNPVVFILWGKSAEEKCDRILSKRNHDHLVLKAAHPSPYSAHHFLGCRHFSKTNAYLEKWGRGGIDWRLG